MKLSIRDISIAACGAFVAIVLVVDWIVPVGAQTAGQLPIDEVVQNATTSFQAWSSTSAIFAKDANALSAAYRHQLAEIAQLKDELAKAKAAAPPPAPAPNNSGISTQGQHGDNTIGPKP